MATADYTRLSQDLFYVLTFAGVDSAVSLFHGGRHLGDGKAYKVEYSNHFLCPAIVAMDLDIDRDFKVIIVVTGHHLPGIEDMLFGGAATPAEKIAFIESKLKETKSH